MSNNNFEKRYTPTLTPAVQHKAFVELREPKTNQGRLEAVDKLRTAFFKSDHEMKLLRSDDKFFLRFLRAKKFDHLKALAMIINYHKQRENWQDLFKKVSNPASLHAYLSAGCIGIVPLPAKDGSTVVVGWPGRKEGMLVTDMIACIVLTLEKLLENEEVQVHGITVIEDLTYYNLAFAKQMTPKVGKRFAALIQDAMPVRLKSLNIVNESKIFDVVLAILRPFMKEKIKRRLHIHGRNYSGLQRILNVEALPNRFGGKFADLEMEKCTSNFFTAVHTANVRCNMDE